VSVTAAAVPSPTARPAAAQPAVRRPPPNVLAAVRLGDGDGPGPMLYTCEPTLLPPIAHADRGDAVEKEPAVKKPPRSSARKKETTSAWEIWVKESVEAKKRGQAPPPLPGL
jgi:hypothetical protein